MCKEGSFSLGGSQECDVLLTYLPRDLVFYLLVGVSTLTVICAATYVWQKQGETTRDNDIGELGFPIIRIIIRLVYLFLARLLHSFFLSIIQGLFP